MNLKQMHGKGGHRRQNGRQEEQIQRIVSLYQRAERDRTGMCVVEGIRHIAMAVKNRETFEMMVAAPDLLHHPFARKLAQQLRQMGTPCCEISPEAYSKLSQHDEPPGLMVVVKQRWEELERIRPGRGLCWLAVESVQAPGNLGTIIRTCEAVGGSGILFIGEEGDPFDPAAVRASMGALFAQKFVRTSLEKFADWKQHHQCTLVGTSPSASDDYHAVTYPKPTMLLLGCEKRGLSLEAQALCDLMVRIPMVGQTDSLNVAIATSILLYELFNQRRDGRQTR
jgi:TrmH family RNA methyltransferase